MCTPEIYEWIFRIFIVLYSFWLLHKLSRDEPIKKKTKQKTNNGDDAVKQD